MKEPFVFYRAVDPQKGSWDGYGFFAQEGSDFLAFVADAPSGASIQTPELIRAFWAESIRAHSFSGDPALGCVEMADSMNRLQDYLRKQSRSDAALYQSTLCVARLSGRRLFYASIGDSCLFLLRNQQSGSGPPGTPMLYRLDTAETWNGALIVRGQEDQSDRQKTGPIRFVGVDGAFVDPSSVRVLDLHPGERLVFATDGICDVLNPASLLKLIQSPQDAIRAQLDRSFSADRIRDDATLLVLDPSIAAKSDVSAELQALKAQMERLQNDNARLHRELQQATTLSSRLDRVEKRIEQPRAAARPPRAAANVEPRYTEPATKSFTMRLWLWVAAAFLGGLILGLSIFLWTSQSSAAPEEKARPAAAVIPERRPTITPPSFSEPVECLYTVQAGDSLGKVASARNISVETLLQLNPAVKANTALKIGQRLQVCRKDIP